jgi:hypothetical protein
MKKFLTVLFCLIILLLPGADLIHAYTDSAGFNPLPVLIKAQGSGVPVGTVVAWPASSNPDDAENWLDCNGQSTSGYPELAAIVGPTVPNYQGMFLRGHGSQSHAQNNGSTVGVTNTVHSSGALGVVQGDAMREITAGGIIGDGDFDRLPAINQSYPPTWGAMSWDYVDLGGKGGIAHDGYDNDKPEYSGDFRASLVAPTGNENRPVNIAVRYLIRARP